MMVPLFLLLWMNFGLGDFIGGVVTCKSCEKTMGASSSSASKSETRLDVKANHGPPWRWEATDRKSTGLVVFGRPKDPIRSK